jgi:hypothetical protein
VRAPGSNTRQMDTMHKSTADDTVARAVAIGALAAIALIHILQLPDAFLEIGYLGALFIVAIVGCLAVAAAMTRTSDDRVWQAAGGLAALILLCYVISRSIGLPGFTDDIGEWSEPLGLASMVAEGFLVFVTAAVLVTRREPMTREATTPTSGGAAMRPGPAVG